MATRAHPLVEEELGGHGPIVAPQAVVEHHGLPRVLHHVITSQEVVPEQLLDPAEGQLSHGLHGNVLSRLPGEQRVVFQRGVDVSLQGESRRPVRDRRGVKGHAYN